MKKTVLSLLTLTFLVAGCSGAMRSIRMFREDTAKLFDSKSADMSACYTEVLKSDKDAAGRVTVSFVWSKADGSMKDLAVVPAQTNAPEAVQQCVLTSLSGLQLSPKDVVDGQGTWGFDFQPAN